MAGSSPATEGMGMERREGFCGVSRSVVRSVRTYVSTRDELTTQKTRARADRIHHCRQPAQNHGAAAGRKWRARWPDHSCRESSPACRENPRWHDSGTSSPSCHPRGSCGCGRDRHRDRWMTEARRLRHSVRKCQNRPGHIPPARNDHRPSASHPCRW